MTRLTRNAATQVFVTVTTDILSVETNSQLSLALFQVGVQDILDLIGLSFAEIESLTYRPAPTDDDTTPVAIAVPTTQPCPTLQGLDRIDCQPLWTDESHN